MFKSLIYSLIFSLLVVFVIIAMAFSSRQLSNVNCEELVVIIPHGTPRFISEEEIKRRMHQTDGKLFEKKLNEINTEMLEFELQKEAAIRNVEIFRRVTGKDMDFKGRLLVKVEQREPVVRIMNDREDFYMDKEGIRIGASSQFTAKVLVVNGHPDEKQARAQLLPLVNFINENEFWKAQIEQIHVQKNGEIIMVPQVGDQLIEFGNAKNYRTKFRNLRALYEQTFSKKGWDFYSKINLKYTNQVVCTKK